MIEQGHLFDPPKPKPKPVPVSRALFGQLCIECGVDWRQMTHAERGRFNRAAKELKEVGATPEDVAERAEIFREMYDVRLTPTALSANWAQLEPVL